MSDETTVPMPETMEPVMEPAPETMEPTPEETPAQ